MPRKKPMAQATFSWPFGPIHLEKHQGAAQDERFALIFAAPGPHLRGLPLGMGKNFRRAKFEWLFAIPSGPLRRRGFRIPRFARLGKARSLHRSSSPTQTRFAGLCVGGRLRRPNLGCTLRSAPFGLVGLKCGSGGRCILRRFLISVGAAHWVARGFQVLHTFLQPCRGDPCGCPPVGGTARPGGRALQRSWTRGRRAATWGRPYRK